MKKILVVALLLSLSLIGINVFAQQSPTKVVKEQSLDKHVANKFNPVDVQELAQRFSQWKMEQFFQKQGSRNPQANGVMKGTGRIGTDGFQVWREAKQSTPFFAVGKWPKKDASILGKAAPETRAFAFLKDQTRLMGLKKAEEEFRVHKIVHDHLGETHIRMQQTYQGLDVWGKDIVIHIERDGYIRGFNGRYVGTPAKLLDINEKISSETAVTVVKSDLQVTECEIDHCQKKIYIGENNEPVLVWHIILDVEWRRWYYFVDAKSGDIVHFIDYTMTDGPTTGTGVDLAGQSQTVHLYQKGADYYMMDLSRPMYNAAQSNPPEDVTGGIVVYDIRNQDVNQNTNIYYVMSNDKNNWPANAVSLTTGLGHTYEYFRTVHGRNSIDNNGMTVYGFVNVKQNFNNAFWNGKAVWFGNGDGAQFNDWCGALDLIGHEYTHGVTQHSANLIYEFQSGALNEALSDIFGSLIEWQVEGENGDWLLAEDIYTPGKPGDAMRDMENPSGPTVDLKLPPDMSDYRHLPNTAEGDWGGVHYNCSIVSRAAVLIANAIGRDKMGFIFHRAQTNYLTQSSQFIDARIACVKSAQDLYGAGGAEEQAVKNAFDTVQIFDSNPTTPPPDLPPVQGDEWVLMKATGNELLYRASTDGSLIEPLTTATTVANRPSVSDDGSYVLFVDGTNNLIGVNSDGTGETNFSQGSDFEGIIGSVAQSPNGRYVSFTLSYADPNIYIMDFNDNMIYYYPLYSPNTQIGGDLVFDVLHADAMDFDFDSEFILFDCLVAGQAFTGEDLQYWRINLLRISDGVIFNIFPPMPEGVNLGNPVFASTNDYIFAYDYMDSFGNSAIFAANVETGEEGIIQANNFGKWGFPSYNPNDNMIVFHTAVTDGMTTWDGLAQKQMAADKITGVANSEYVYLQFATYPVWFAVGARAPVDDEAVHLPKTLALYENYPNPFNPVTVIPFQLSERGEVRLSIYNLRGERVSDLIHETMMPGQHTIQWNATDLSGRPVSSGVYLVRIETENQTLSRKMILMR